jgi:hypothetical protein
LAILASLANSACIGFFNGLLDLFDLPSFHPREALNQFCRN